MRPSAPMPRRRWQSRRASSAVASTWSSTTRKSLPRPWCLLRRTPTSPSQPGPHGHEIATVRLPLDRLPADAGIAAEPALLAAGEAAGAAHRHLDRLVEAEPAGEVGQELPVAEGLAGGGPEATGPGGEGFDLVEEAGAELGGVALGDAPIELGAGPTQPDEIGVDVGVGVEAGAGGGERPAAAAAHLERPHDAPPVGRLDARRPRPGRAGRDDRAGPVRRRPPARRRARPGRRGNGRAARGRRRRPAGTGRCPRPAAPGGPGLRCRPAPHRAACW